MTVEEQAGGRAGGEDGEAAGGDTDLRKSLRLLWGVPAPPRRGPKPKVTGEQIITAAIELADEQGLEAVSMRRVAQRLGLTAMSLYAYVPSKDVLIDAMLDRILGRRASRAPAGEGWREGLHRLAHESWDLHRRHPWAQRVDRTRRPFGPNTLAGLEENLRIVSGLGLDPQEMAHIVNTVDDYVDGALAARLETGRAAQDSGVSDEDWLERHGALLAEFADLGQYPTLLQLWEQDILTQREVDFDFGLQRVLDGIEQYIASRSAGS